jgi:thiol-disulfide isomerase/thioredoxin
MARKLTSVGVFLLVVAAILMLDPTLTPVWLKDFFNGSNNVANQTATGGPLYRDSRDSTNELQQAQLNQPLGILTPGIVPKSNEPAPDFALRDLDGNIVKLSDFRGEKNVILNFWATWCSPCKVEMPDLEEIYLTYGKDLVILGVDIQEPIGEIHEFLNEEILVTYPILLDTEGLVTLGYNIFAQPTTYFISKEGTIIPINSLPGKYGAFTPGELRQRIEEFFEHVADI